MSEEIEKAIRKNTAKAWRDAHLTAKIGSEEEAYCRKKALECAKKENTAEAWRHAYLISEIGSAEGELCMEKLRSF